MSWMMEATNKQTNTQTQTVGEAQVQIAVSVVLIWIGDFVILRRTQREENEPGIESHHNKNKAYPNPLEFVSSLTAKSHTSRAYGVRIYYARMYFVAATSLACITHYIDYY